MTRAPIRPVVRVAPAINRLAGLTRLDGAALAALTEAVARPQDCRPRRDLMSEGRDVTGPLLMLSGWAARVRILPDGRRQFLNFLLPGDLVGLYHHARPASPATIVTLTAATICAPPAWGTYAMLDEVYAISQALDEAHLLAQITRLGRMNAMERIGDLMLELHERLGLAGLTQGNGFALPITQETLADALGLTAVHVNRMLQAARRAGDMIWSTRSMTIPDPTRLARKVGRTPIRVVAS